MYTQYLKLYNHCLNEIEPLTYKALSRTIIQVRKNEKLEKILVLRKDLKTIGLVFEKFIKRQFDFPERKTFLRELYSVLRNQYSIKIFIQVPNYLHLLNDLLNLDPNGDASDGDVRATIQKILRKFITFTLLEDDQQRVSDLINLIEFNSLVSTSSQKQIEQVSKKEEDAMDPETKLSSHNFFKLLKPIEFTLKEYKERFQKNDRLEESKSRIDSPNEKATNSFKKSIIPNILQFMSYFEHFLLKIGKVIEQEEVQIAQFTSGLFDFLHVTQILYLTLPAMKQIPLEIYANILVKKFESICYRNGGPIISMLTILFTVLKNSKIPTEKTGLLKCCGHILGFNYSSRGSEAFNFKAGVEIKTELKKEANNSANAFKNSLASASRNHSSSEVKKYMSLSLVDPTNADKLPDLLLQKVTDCYL